MPCGTRARLTAYVAYQNLTFAELDVLLSALTDAGVDYAVEPDTYKGGVIFASERIGAFFYVLPDSVEPARAIMLQRGFKMNQQED